MSSVISVVQNYGFASASYFGEVAKNISNFLSIDDGLAAKEDYPIQNPISGTEYSYETWIRLRCDYPPNTQCTNILAWYDAGLPVGANITVNSNIVSTYTQPIDTVSSTGTRVNFNSYNSELSSISLDGILINIGDVSSWLVFQLETTNTQELGDHEVTYIIQFDES